MIRRTQKIVADILAERGKMGDRSVVSRLVWSGDLPLGGKPDPTSVRTKHLGLNANFTVLDRGDARRPDGTSSVTSWGIPPRTSGSRARMPGLAIYTYRVNTRLSLKQTLDEQYPLVPRMGSGSHAPVPRVCGPQAEA